VECLAPNHCDEGRTCDAVSRRCAVPCSDDDDCTGGNATKCAASRGICVECVDDGHCSDSRDETFCETTWGECVGCLDDDNCSTDAPYCAPSHLHGEACLEDGHCPEGSWCSDDGQCRSER
jgi:hypothetical protein